MHEFLKNLQSKSDRYKKIFSLVVSGGVTVVIFLFWISGSYTDFSKISIIPKNGPDLVTPFSTFKKGVAQVYQSMQNEYGEVKVQVKNENLISTSTPVASLENEGSND